MQLLAKVEEAPQNRASNLVATLRRILQGERDKATLVDPLDYDDSIVVIAVLQGIADPSYLERFASEEQPSEP